MSVANYQPGELESATRNSEYLVPKVIFNRLEFLVFPFTKFIEKDLLAISPALASLGSGTRADDIRVGLAVDCW